MQKCMEWWRRHYRVSAHAATCRQVRNCGKSGALTLVMRQRLCLVEVRLERLRGCQKIGSGESSIKVWLEYRGPE